MEGFPEELEVPEFQSYLLSQLRQLQQEEALCDVRLTTELGSVAAHRIVLTATSPYLRSRLAQRSTETDNVHFDDIPLVLLETVVRYLYTGKLVVCKSDVVQLQKFCEVLGLTHAIDACKNYVKQNGGVKLKPVDVDAEEEEVDTKDGLKELITVSDNNVIVSGIKKEIVSPKGRTGRRTVLAPRKRTAVVGNGEAVVPTDEGTAKVDTSPIKKKRGRPTRPKLDKTVKKIGKRKSTEGNLEKHVKGKKKKRKLKDDDTMTTEDTSASIKQDVEDKDSEVNEGDLSDDDELNTNDSDDVDFIGAPKKKRIWKRRARQNHPCTACSKKLSNLKRLAFHEYSKHDIPFDTTKYAWFPCKKEGCTYVAANRHNLDTHMKSRHGVLRPHICEFCGKAFKLPNVLATHINIHTGSKIFHCEQCGQQFNQQSGLDVHVKRHHSGESTWVEMCHICSEKFLQKSDLAWHLFKAHDQTLPERYKAHTCEICSYLTKSVQDLERHMNAHKGIKEHPCPICPKHCKTKSELKRHIGFHGEKSFKCTFESCSFACTDAIGLGKHVRYMHTHRNYKPYVCPVCHYKTGVKGNQDKHIRTVHDLIVVAKHTVPLKMKFKNFQSGDVITKDGRLVATAIERKKLMSQEYLPDEDEANMSMNLHVKNTTKSSMRKKKKFDTYDDVSHRDVFAQNQNVSTYSAIQTSAESQPGGSDDKQFTILDNYMHSKAHRNSQSKDIMPQSDDLPPQLSVQSDTLQSNVPVASHSEDLQLQMAARSEEVRLQMQMTSQSEDLRSRITTQSEDLRSHMTTQSEDLRSRMTSQSEDLRSHMTSQSEGLRSHMTSQSEGLRSHMTTQSEDLRSHMTSQSEGLRSHIPLQSEDLRPLVSHMANEMFGMGPTSYLTRKFTEYPEMS